MVCSTLGLTRDTHSAPRAARSAPSSRHTVEGAPREPTALSISHAGRWLARAIARQPRLELGAVEAARLDVDVQALDEAVGPGRRGAALTLRFSRCPGYSDLYIFLIWSIIDGMHMIVCGRCESARSARRRVGPAVVDEAAVEEHRVQPDVPGAPTR